MKLWPVDIDPREVGENFDPSKIDFENVDREKTKGISDESYEKSSCLI